MDKDKTLKLEAIYTAAERAKPKGDYSVYKMYRENIEDLNLNPEEYQESIHRLAKLLKV